MNPADKILVIQDSPLINAMLKSRLESADFLVETAETGEEGLTKVLAASYRLILLDYKLPGMDGNQVCRILKGKTETKDVPVVFLSGQDEKQLAALVKETGAQGYITLPFQGEALVRSVREFIAGHGQQIL